MIFFITGATHILIALISGRIHIQDIIKCHVTSSTHKTLIQWWNTTRNPPFVPSPPLPLFPFPLHPLLLPWLVCLQKAMAIHSILFTLALRTLGRESSQILIKVGGPLKHFMKPEFPESFGNARSLLFPLPHNEGWRSRTVEFTRVEISFLTPP